MATNEELERGNELLRDQSEQTGFLKDAFKSLGEEIKTSFNNLADDISGIDSLSKRLAKTYERDIVGSINKMTRGLKTSLKAQQGLNKGLDIEKNITAQLEKNELERLLLMEDIAVAQRMGVDINEETITGLKETIKLEKERLTLLQNQNKEISSLKSVKGFDALSDLTKSIPGLRKLSSPFQEAAKQARLTVTRMSNLNAERVKAGETPLFSKKQMSLGGLKTGIKSLGKSLMKSLGPIFLLKELVDAFLQSDKIIGDMAKGLNMSYSEALDMKQELTAAANASDSIFVTSKGMAETLMTINKTLGTNVMLNKEDLATFTKLRTVAGFTNDELMGIQSLSLATGKSLEDNTKEFIAQAKISSIQNGVLLNEKELAKDIKNISAATTLSYSKNPKLIAEAVAITKALGMEMSKVEGIADSLLNFESSIANELEAELLLGKNINLEKARQAALTNDIATLSQEITNQIGDSADFSEMNRIQQDALAKSVGISREELAKTLYIQDQLAGATGKEAEEKRKLINAQIESNGLAAVQKQIGDEGFKSLEKQASMQDRFNQSVEKLKGIFTTVAEAIMPIFEALMPIFEALVPVFNLVGAIAKLLDPMIQFTTTGFSFVGDLLGGDLEFKGTKKQVMKTEDSFQDNWAKPLGSNSKGFNIYNRPTSIADDAIIPAGYGNTIIKKGKDSIALNNNDTVVAGTNLNQDSTDNKTSQALGETNILLKQILNKQGTVSMNATNVGTAFSVNTYEVQ